MDFGALFAGIATVISGLVAAFTSAHNTRKTNEANLANQNMVNEMNSVSSKVAEYEKNGINKQLVSGIAPSYTASAHLQTPNLSGLSEIGNAFGKAMDYAKGKNDIYARKKELEYQGKKVSSETALMDAQKARAEADTAKAKLEKDIVDHDRKIILKRPYLSNDPWQLRLISGGNDLVKDITGVDVLGAPKSLLGVMKSYIDEKLTQGYYENKYEEERKENLKGQARYDTFSQKPLSSYEIEVNNARRDRAKKGYKK